MADNLKELGKRLKEANEAKKGKGVIDVEDVKRGVRKLMGRPEEDFSKRVTESSYAGKNVTPSEKKKASKPATQKLKDTSGEYWSADGLSGDMGSASGEVGADMGKVNKGGYDASEGMKRGGTVSSASKRADGCAVRGKTRGRMV